MKTLHYNEEKIIVKDAVAWTITFYSLAILLYATEQLYSLMYVSLATIYKKHVLV
jgi:hypothetical protein